METNLKTTITKAPYADVAHTLIEAHDYDRPLSLFAGDSRHRCVELLAHVPREFGPQSCMLPADHTSQSNFFQTTIVSLHEEVVWDGLDCNTVICRLEIFRTVFHNCMHDGHNASMIGNDADATLSENITYAMFPAIVDPFADERKLIMCRSRVAETRRRFAARSQGGDDIVAELLYSRKDGGCIDIETLVRFIRSDEVLRSYGKALCQWKRWADRLKFWPIRVTCIMSNGSGLSGLYASRCTRSTLCGWHMFCDTSILSCSSPRGCSC
jgi:hypothetical protein